jgi:hypothetical protein
LLQERNETQADSTGASHTWSSAGAVTHYNTWDWLSGTDWHRDAYSTGNTSTATNTKATFRNTAHRNRGCSWGLKPPVSSRLRAM